MLLCSLNKIVFDEQSKINTNDIQQLSVTVDVGVEPNEYNREIGLPRDTIIMNIAER